ncbi:unnamed protein product, partial [Oikopleura dioica]
SNVTANPHQLTKILEQVF